MKKRFRFRERMAGLELRIPVFSEEKSLGVDAPELRTRP